MANHNSHSASHSKAHSVKPGSANRKRGVPTPKQLVGLAKSLQRQVEKGMETHPVATVAAVGGASFALGAIFGSRVGRTVMMAAAPFIVRRVLESTIGQDIEDYVRPIFEQMKPDASKN